MEKGWDIAQRFPVHGFKTRNKKLSSKGVLSKTLSEFEMNRSQKMHQMNVILFGFGNVGQEFTKMIVKNRDIHSELFNTRFNFKAVFDSSGFIYTGNNTGSFESSITDGTLLQLMEWKNKGNSLRVFRDIGYYYTDFERLTTQLLGGHNCVLIDCSNTINELDHVFSLHSQKGGGIVTANRAHLASKEHLFNMYTRSEYLPRFGYEATIGGITPYINTLNQIILSGDYIYKMDGIINPCLGYILSKWQNTMKQYKHNGIDIKNTYIFSDILLNAHKIGLSQPNGIDDITCLDALRQGIILARTVGIDRYNMEDYYDLINNGSLHILFPQIRELMNWNELTPTQMMNALKQINDYEFYEYFLSILNENIDIQNLNLKYITTIDADNEILTLQLKNINNNDDPILSNTNGVNCVFKFQTDMYPEKYPLIIQGKGGSIQATSSALINDLYRVSVALDHTI